MIKCKILDAYIGYKQGTDGSLIPDILFMYIKKNGIQQVIYTSLTHCFEHMFIIDEFIDANPINGLGLVNVVEIQSKKELKVVEINGNGITFYNRTDNPDTINLGELSLLYLEDLSEHMNITSYFKILSVSRISGLKDVYILIEKIHIRY